MLCHVGDCSKRLARSGGSLVHGPMARAPAQWRLYLTDEERAELKRAERKRDVAADQLRTLTKLLKDRCVRRRIRENKDGVAKP